MRKPTVSSPSNRSRRLCKRFCESEEARRMILLSREEKQIRPKVEGDKRTFSFYFSPRIPLASSVFFFLIFTISSEWAALILIKESLGVSCSGPAHQKLSTRSAQALSSCLLRKHARFGEFRRESSRPRGRLPPPVIPSLSSRRASRPESSKLDENPLTDY